ncbi:hypothetical protein [Lederbergia citri]|nr:hypothetical protein [Lederbergia citri]
MMEGDPDNCTFIIVYRKMRAVGSSPIIITKWRMAAALMVN